MDFLGGGASELEIECVKSWSRYTRGYEFVELSEQNFDVHKDAIIEKAYEKSDFELVNKLAVLTYLQKNGGIGLSAKMKMNAPIGELRVNDVSFVYDEKHVYTFFVACTSENEMLKLLLDKVKAESELCTESEFEMIVNDFVRFISNDGRQPFRHSKYTTGIFTLNRVGYNFDKNNLLELMDQTICNVKENYKSIGKVLTEEQSIYLDDYINKQADEITALTSRVQQLENSRVLRYAKKVYSICSHFKR